MSETLYERIKKNIERRIQETDDLSSKSADLFCSGTYAAAKRQGRDPWTGSVSRIRAGSQARLFSQSGYQDPPSLRNIYKELELEYHVPVHRTGDLRDWAKQGVLLLNPILTVREHQPLSHQKIGWQLFTNEILKALNQMDQPMVFILWGSKAREAKKILTNPAHLIIESAHPSPLSASRGFFGSNCFKRANEYLAAHHENPINWIETNE